MIAKVELYQGEVYLLTDWGEIWHLKFVEGMMPLIQKLGNVHPERSRELCLPQLPFVFPQ